MKPRARLARLEASLPAAEAVLAWLAQVNAYGSLAAYARAEAEANPTQSPLWAMVARVEACAIQDRAGSGRAAEIRAAAREEAHAALRLSQCLLAMNFTIEETLAREGLALAGLAYRLRPPCPKGVSLAAGADLSALAERIYRVQETRLLLEHHYLANHSCLLAEGASTWQELLDGVERFGAAAGMPLGRARTAARAGAGPAVTALAHAADWSTRELLADRARADALADARLEGPW